VVEGNFLMRCGDSGIQAAAEAIVTNNIVLDSPLNGINSHDHQCETVDLEVVHNTVVGASTCMRLSDWGGRAGMVLANNAIYCPGATAIDLASGSDSVAIEGNVVLGSVSGATAGWVDGAGIDADLVDAASLDVWPTATSALIAAASDAFATAVDFNGTERSSPHTAGAYHHSGASNPGWRPGPGFKDEVVDAPDADERAEAVETGPDAATDTAPDAPGDPGDE
jgi:hypothetical protein